VERREKSCCISAVLLAARFACRICGVFVFPLAGDFGACVLTCVASRRAAVQFMLYVYVRGRPEISAALGLGLCGTCLTICTEELYANLERVLIYLARTKKIGTTFSAHTNGAKKLRAYADANWTTTRSTTSFVIMLAGGAIAHASRRQHCISMSTCEAELIALADCCRPAVVPAVVSAEVVLESAAVAHPQWPDICASPSLACRRPRADHSKLPSNESKRGVNPTRTEPQPDTAEGKHHRGEIAQGGNSTRGNPPANTLSTAG